MAIIDPEITINNIDKIDLRIEWYSGTGCGGSNRNKKQNSCRITHIPSGTVVTSQTRSRKNSLKLAMDEITIRVNQTTINKSSSETAAVRKEQVGSGMRGDKKRTIQFQNNRVTDHVTGKKMSADRYMKGFIDDLWK